MAQVKQRWEATRRPPIQRIRAGARALVGLRPSVRAARTPGHATGPTETTISTTQQARSVRWLKIWLEMPRPKGLTGATAGRGGGAAELGIREPAGGVIRETCSGKGSPCSLGTKLPDRHAHVTNTWGKWPRFVTERPAQVKFGAGSAGLSEPALVLVALMLAPELWTERER